MNYIKTYFTNAFNFSGRTTRKGFWMTFLYLFIFQFLVTMVMYLIFGEGIQRGNADETTFATFLYSIISFMIGFPYIALQIRRLHDSNHSGWWMLLYFTVIGGVVSLIFSLLPSTPGENQYGPEPYTTD